MCLATVFTGDTVNSIQMDLADGNLTLKQKNRLESGSGTRHMARGRSPSGRMAYVVHICRNT